MYNLFNMNDKGGRIYVINEFIYYLINIINYIT